MACREKLIDVKVSREQVVEGGAHWQPKGKFSVELMRIFAESSKEN